MDFSQDLKVSLGFEYVFRKGEMWLVCVWTAAVALIDGSFLGCVCVREFANSLYVHTESFL